MTIICQLESGSGAFRSLRASNARLTSRRRKLCARPSSAVSIEAFEHDLSMSRQRRGGLRLGRSRSAAILGAWSRNTSDRSWLRREAISETRAGAATYSPRQFGRAGTLTERMRFLASGRRIA
jgi:hypothetical protein